MRESQKIKFAASLKNVAWLEDAQLTFLIFPAFV